MLFTPEHLDMSVYVSHSQRIRLPYIRPEAVEPAGLFLRALASVHLSRSETVDERLDDVRVLRPRIVTYVHFDFVPSADV